MPNDSSVADESFAAVLEDDVDFGSSDTAGYPEHDTLENEN